MGTPRLFRPLTARERICLHCPLPECNEDDPRCPFHQQYPTLRTRWSWLNDKIDALTPEQPTFIIEFDSRRILRQGQSSLYNNHYRRPGSIAFRTRSEPVDSELPAGAWRLYCTLVI